jgi:hypothetical protein
VKGAETKASAVKLDYRPNFRTDHAGVPNPFPQEAIRESTIEKQEFTLNLNKIWRRERN